MPLEFTRAELLAVLPSMLLFVTGIAVLLADLIARSDADGTGAGAAADGHAAKHHLAFIGAGGGLLALASVAWMVPAATGAPAQALLAGAICSDPFARFAAALIMVAALFTTLSAGPYLAAQGVHRGEFHALVWMGAGSMVLLAQAANLISIFVAIETLSLSVYVLAGFFRKWKQGSEGAMKYFVMGAFSSGFLLLGMALLYGATESVDLAALARPDADPDLLLVGLLLVLVGFAFKIGAVPFHSWVPDVYQGAPAIAAGWMAVAVKAASFAVLVRLVLAAGGESGILLEAGEYGLRMSLSGETIAKLVAALSVATMILGNLAAIRQTNVKRMLAYSGIAHSGYLLIPVYLAFRSEDRAAATSAVLVYLAAYLLMTFGAFAVVAIVSRGDRDREDVRAYHGLAKRHPPLAAAFTIFLLSLAGIPVTAGFIGKLLVFQGAVAAASSNATGEWQQGIFNLALVGILASIVSAYYYLRPVMAMYFHEPSESFEKVDAPWGLHLTLGLSAAGTIVLGLFPSRLIDLASSSVATFASG